MNTPNSREEMILAALAKGEECCIDPQSREEMYLVEQARREASGGGSWNNLKDKPFYTETEIILEKQTIDGFTTLGNDYYVFVDIAVNLADYDNVTLYWDGEKYDCAVEHKSGGTLDQIVIKENGKDALVINSMFGKLEIQDYRSTATSHEIGIYWETIHKMDAKYLPYDLVFGCNSVVNAYTSASDFYVETGSPVAVKDALMRGDIPRIRIHNVGAFSGEYYANIFAPSGVVYFNDSLQITFFIEYNKVRMTVSIDGEVTAWEIAE